LDKLEAEQKEINGPNISSGQLAAMFVILESALIIPFSMLYTDFN
jgi:membrane protein CcdC involved in cytochrome C biogenesis